MNRTISYNPKAQKARELAAMRLLFKPYTPKTSLMAQVVLVAGFCFVVAFVVFL